MGSTVAWLDTSAEEQRRARDLIALFSQQESRDELGIGQIRDALSDLLFPGTSVLQTRARYFLIVPWAFQRAARIGSGRDLAGKARVIERQVVEVLTRTGDEGVIGRRAGAAVKNLPSQVFWSGLRRYGILTTNAGPEQLTGAVLRTQPADAADELVERSVGEWHPTLPPPPAGFPSELADGLTMTEPEAQWLRDRIVETSRGTLLEHLVLEERPPGAGSAPWEVRVVNRAPEKVLHVVELAHGFSLMMNGAALLYNYLVAKRYVDAGFTRVDDPVHGYRDAYEEWLAKIRGQVSLLASWQAGDLWALADGATGAVTVRTREFVEDWTRAVRDGSVDAALTDPGGRLRHLVASRERSIKKGQSRLTNTKLLGGWSGASGTGELVFRWPQVRRIVTDIHDGLSRA